VEHLSDFSKCAPQLLHCYRPGQVIEEAVVWVYSKLQTVLTLKPTVMKIVKENCYPKSVDEIEMNSILPCVALRHKLCGVFASVLCPPKKFDVLFPSCKIPPQLNSSLEKDTMHVSLEGQVIKVDKEENKIYLSALNPYNRENAAL
jgi:hypothetical protein